MNHDPLTMQRRLEYVLGTMVEVDGETLMLVAVQGQWAVFENEGERTMRVPLTQAYRWVVENS